MDNPTNFTVLAWGLITLAALIGLLKLASLPTTYRPEKPGIYDRTYLGNGRYRKNNRLV